MKVVVERSSRDKEIMAMGTVLYDLPMIDSYVLQVDEANLSQFKKLKRITYYQTTKIAAQVESHDGKG